MIHMLMFSLLASACFAAPPLDLRDYGATLNGSGVGDSAALDAAIADIASGVKGTSTIQFGGLLTLTHAPPPLVRVHLRGDDIYGSQVLKRYPGGILFYFNSWSGGGLHNFTIPQDTGTPNSYTILVRAGPVHAPDGLQLEDLYIGPGTGPGPWRSIEIEGSGRPLGIRQVRIRNVTCFGSSGYGNVVIDQTVDLHAIALRSFPAGGTFGNIIWGPGNPGKVEL